MMAKCEMWAAGWKAYTENQKHDKKPQSPEAISAAQLL